MQNFRRAPLGELLLFVFTFSLLSESGVASVLRRKATLKQRRALQAAAIVFVLSTALLLLFTFMPGSLLLSSFGTFAHSPLLYGLYPIILGIFALTGITYGYLSGRFLNAADILRATTALSVRIAGFFVSVLFASQFIACLQYVFPDFTLFRTDHLLAPLYILFYYLPLVVAIILKEKGKA